jgi:hypothetical protein
MAKRTAVVVAAASLLAGMGARARGQSDADMQTRQLWDDAFKKKRQEAAQPTPTRPMPVVQAIGAKPSANALGDLADSLVGITLWRLRPLAPPDASRGAMVFAVGSEELTAQRVEAGTVFAPGERMRLGIEAARTGYLYLIDREKYADGTLGDPYLIFPRSRIRGGNNKVTAGRLIEIPDMADTPPFFTMKRSRPDQVGDVLTVLLTPEPLPDLPLGRSALKLSNEQVASWEKKWRAPAKKIEMAGGAGALYTKAEREAGGGVGTRLLTQEEPVPQTMYKVEAKPGEALMVTVNLAVDREPQK